jgi:hypothetical protein
VWSQIAKENQIISQDRGLFSDSRFVCDRIASIVNSFYFKSESHRFFVCKDNELDEIQAIAVVDNNPIYQYAPNVNLEFMVTHPKNIRSNINKNNPNRVEGSGKTLIQKIADVYRQEDKRRITLFSLDSSLHFYFKIGFKIQEKENPHQMKLYLEI